MTVTNFPDSLLRRWETYRWDDANLSAEFGTTDVGDILRVIVRWVRQDRAAGVTVAPALDVERLREAAQAVVDRSPEDHDPEGTHGSWCHYCGAWVNYGTNGKPVPIRHDDGCEWFALRAALATGDEP